MNMGNLRSGGPLDNFGRMNLEYTWTSLFTAANYEYAIYWIFHVKSMLYRNQPHGWLGREVQGIKTQVEVDRGQHLCCSEFFLHLTFYDIRCVSPDSGFLMDLVSLEEISRGRPDGNLQAGTQWARPYCKSRNTPRSV